MHRAMSQLTVARKISPRSMHRYWLVQAATRELQALASLEQERQNLRQQWQTIRTLSSVDSVTQESQ